MCQGPRGPAVLAGSAHQFLCVSWLPCSCDCCAVGTLLVSVSVSVSCERASSVHLTPAGRRPAGTDQPLLLHLADWCAPVWSPLREEWTLFTGVFALHTPRPQLSMLARHSVNKWNATLVRAHSGMKVRWTDRTMRDGLRMISVRVEQTSFVAAGYSLN